MSWVANCGRDISRLLFLVRSETPNLQSSSFTAANAEPLLDNAAREFVHDPRGATVTGRKLVVSSIYLWYEAGFGGSETGVIAALRRYAKPELASALAIIDQISSDSCDRALTNLRQ